MSQDELPEPVSRYLQLALGSLAAPIEVAKIFQHGDLRTTLESQRWLRFTASEVVKPADFEFEWNARVRVAPLVRLRVHDAYRNGEGEGRVSALGITIANERGGAALNAGSLFRLLAEAPWFPTLLLPSEKLRWSAIDRPVQPRR